VIFSQAIARATLAVALFFPEMADFNGAAAVS
jgi:hypothetical protein